MPTIEPAWEIAHTPIDGGVPCSTIYDTLVAAAIVIYEEMGSIMNKSNKLIGSGGLTQKMRKRLVSAARA